MLVHLTLVVVERLHLRQRLQPVTLVAVCLTLVAVCLTSVVPRAMWVRVIYGIHIYF